MFLDFSSQIDIAAVGFEHGRMGDAKGFLIRTSRYMDDIGIGFDGLGNLDAFFQAVSAFRKFSTAHAKFDGEKGPTAVRTDCRTSTAKRTRFSREPP